MLYLSKFFLFACFVQLSSTAPQPSTDLAAACGFWTATKFAFKCRALAYDALFIEKTDRTYEDFKSLNEICKDAQGCMDSFECEEIKKMKNGFDNQCEIIGYAYPDNELCLKQFFRTVYMSQFSNEESCFKEYSFLDSDKAKRSQAFADGKLCFIKYAREHCTSTTLEYFNTDKYNQLAKSMSVDNTFDMECNMPSTIVQSIHCTAMNKEFEYRVKQLERPEFASNNDFVVQTRKICRDTQSCFKRNCLLLKDSAYYRQLVNNCDILENSYPK
ncbi:hypothetical protein CAEBREN_22439 [Caenorhabditis brenneri]|uniref:T20D4.11-like domain-containing protein n=1 Tax=Caenorhabditis brenneri TaxID=135651 RepID=G0NF13_CAEBE|nr:hypothetical protein CAEBREN_22439 [Caenorhabditis brenneri]